MFKARKDFHLIFATLQVLQKSFFHDLLNIQFYTFSNAEGILVKNKPKISIYQSLTALI